MVKKANLPPKKDLHVVMRRAKDAGVKEVIVAFSCGKDALATLDICHEHFDRVEAFFMYLVKGISFQVRTIDQVERRYGIKVLQIPHWGKSKMYRNASYRSDTRRSTSVPSLTHADVERFVRAKFGIEWIATGEMACESLQRNAQFKQTQGFNTKSKRLHPLAWWRPQDVQSYLSYRRIPLPSDYFDKLMPYGGRGQVRSWGSLHAEPMARMRDLYPEDFEKVCKEFPLARAQAIRFDIKRKKEAITESRAAED
ncbi:phosphoadenosine phosphosulfate reductase family protein [Kordiimonas sp.]|uniref:phosphoadenosine phosphosulfate reductase domain-containing protein n=1 Tax=Kordiimonas sp. TaxID=1970157 RepID=UPI003A8F6B8F